MRACCGVQCVCGADYGSWLAPLSPGAFVCAVDVVDVLSDMGKCGCGVLCGCVCVCVCVEPKSMVRGSPRCPRVHVCVFLN